LLGLNLEEKEDPRLCTHDYHVAELVLVVGNPEHLGNAHFREDQVDNKSVLQLPGRQR
jgi:hypothetical protein